MTKRRWIAVVAIVAVCVAAVFGIRFVRQHTSLLSFGDVSSDVTRNNAGSSSLGDLVSQPVTVPEPYRVGAFTAPRALQLPEGFSISVFAAGLKVPRFLDFTDDGAVVVADKGAGAVVLLPDTDHDGVADRVITIDDGLRNVHSVDWFEGDLYVGEEHQVAVYRDLQSDGSFSARAIVVPNLPAGGFGAVAGHVTRTVMIGPDRQLYVAVGSSCNVCEETDARRAAILRYALDGSGETVVANGIRNTVGYAFRAHPATGVAELWGVDNGRDLIGDNIPPEEVNRIEFGKHYGWPYCYGDRIANPEFPERADYCQTQTVGPRVAMQAHSAPLGVAFAPRGEARLPAAIAGQFLVAFHGSWNRTVPTGYKVVRLNLDEPQPEPMNFITGWLEASGDAWGRPVDVEFWDGNLYVSDDRAGAIYRISFTANADE